jgi:hypothetical protein
MVYRLEMNIHPWCNCIIRGVWQKQDGFTLDVSSGLWVCSRCRKPSKMNYERLVLGIEPIRVQSKMDDIYAKEQFYEAKQEIEDELGWDPDDDDDDE